MVHLVPNGGKPLLLLIGQSAPGAPPRQLGARPVRRGAWTDLVFHVRWSTGQDGFVEAWLDGRPFTRGKKYGPTLYSPVSNYLRLGLYRGKGVPTTKCASATPTPPSRHSSSAKPFALACVALPKASPSLLRRSHDPVPPS